MRPLHQLLALLVVFIWGTNFVFIRIGLDELDPFTFATLRFVLVAIPLIFFIPKPAVSWRPLAGYGVLIGFGQFGLLFWAMQSDISPGLASLIIQTQVFFTIFLSAALMREAITSSQSLALLLCFIGLGVIIAFTDGQTTPLGIAVILVAALSWAAGNMVVKQAGNVDIFAFIIWSSVFAVPPLALMAWLMHGPNNMLIGVSQLSLQGWAVVLWQTIGNTMLGYGLWNMLLSRYPAALVTPWALLVPVFGMAASSLLLAEPMPWWKLLAIALIFAGLALNVLGATRPKTDTRKNLL